VFDEMPARVWNLNFWNFPLWVINIWAKVSSGIFVMKKRWGLQKSYFKFLVWSLIQIQSFGDVWVKFWFEFWVATSWLSFYVTWWSSTSWPNIDLSCRFLIPRAQSRVVKQIS
jgi:hypothetical protein